MRKQKTSLKLKTTSLLNIKNVYIIGAFYTAAQKKLDKTIISYVKNFISAEKYQV